MHLKPLFDISAASVAKFVSATTIFTMSYSPSNQDQMVLIAMNMAT